MKSRLMALIALAGMVVVGCAHKEKNMGASSDQSTGSYSSDSRNFTLDTNTYNLNNPLNNNTNSNTGINSNPQRQ